MISPAAVVGLLGVLAAVMALVGWRRHVGAGRIVVWTVLALAGIVVWLLFSPTTPSIGD